MIVNDCENGFVVTERTQEYLDNYDMNIIGMILFYSKSVIHYKANFTFIRSKQCTRNYFVWRQSVKEKTVIRTTQ